MADDINNEPKVTAGVVFPRGSTRSPNARMIFGAILITLGTLWTLDNFGILDASAILRWWPLVLIVLGVQRVTGTGTRRKTGWGAVLIVGGILLLADQLEWLNISSGTIWALGFILVGIVMLRPSAFGRAALTGRMRERSERLRGGDVHIGAGETGPVEDPSTRLHVFSMWSHVIRKVVSQQFEFGEVSCVMGGVRIDLRGAKTVPAGAVLDLSVVWGGIEIIVPPTWNVVHAANVMIGGINDHTRQTVGGATDTLVLQGAVIMGGVEIKNN